MGRNRLPPQPPLPGVTHGPRGYRHGCRCEECRTAHRERLDRQTERRAAGLGRPTGPDDWSHLRTIAESRERRKREAAT